MFMRASLTVFVWNVNSWDTSDLFCWHVAKDLRKNTEGLWGARLSAAIVLDSKELLAGETVMTGWLRCVGRCVRCTRHPAKARASLWVQLSRPERSWKPLTNVQRKKLEKSGKIQEDLGKLEALERFELLYRAFSVWALQIVAAQVSTCARFLPTRTFHMFNCRLGGAFSHRVQCGVSFQRNVLTTFALACILSQDANIRSACREKTYHQWGKESLVCWFFGHMLHATESKNRRLSVHFVCNKSTILCTFYHVNVQSNSVHNSTMPLMRGNALQAFGWSCLLVLRVSLVCIIILMYIYIWLSIWLYIYMII